MIINWVNNQSIITYTSTQYIHVYYQPGNNELHFLAKANSAYIDFNKGIKETFIKYNYTFLVDQLINSSSNIVILFASSNHVECY